MCESENPGLKSGRQRHAQFSALPEPDLLEVADHQQRVSHLFQLEAGDDARDGIDCAGAVIAGLDDQRLYRANIDRLDRPTAGSDAPSIRASTI